MNLSQLQTFSTVCLTMSFTEASRQLNLSQSAVSRQILALEAEIGTPLFHREHSTISLTPAGKHLRDNLKEQLPALLNTLEETKRIGSGETGRLRIGLLEDQCLDETISKALRQLRQEHIYLSIQRLNFQALEAKLVNGEIDAAISIAQSADAFPNCSRKIYHHESMCLAIHKDHLPTREILSGQDLERLNFPLLVPSLDSFQRSQYDTLAALTQNGWLGGQEYDFSSIAPMVAAGLAATIANESHNLSVDGSVVLLPLRDLPGVNKGVFWQKDNDHPIIQRLVKHL